MVENKRNCERFDKDCYWMELARKYDDQHMADINCNICTLHKTLVLKAQDKKLNPDNT